MAVYPNFAAAAFCDWILNISGYRLSGPRLSILNAVNSAALANTSVSDQNWTDFNRFTSPLYARYLQWRDLGNAFLAETNSILKYMAPLPSFAYQTAMNDFISTCISDGNWSELDCFWCFATEAREHAYINWANPSSAFLQEINSPTWTPNQGFTGNGSSSYLRSAFIPSTMGVKHLLNDNSGGVYIRTESQSSSAVEMGVHGSVSNDFYYQFVRDTSNLFHVANYSLNENTNSNTSSLGLLSNRRTASNAGAVYRNGTSLGTSFPTSGALANQPVFILCQNSNGTASNFSPRQVSMAFLGSKNVDQSTFYNAFQTFATAIGFNV